MTLASIERWHQTARPTPTNEQFSVQLGCHFEEIAEMVMELLGCTPEADDAMHTLEQQLRFLALKLKGGQFWADVAPEQRGAFLDSLADQIVTAVGVGHCAKMDVPKAVAVVDYSNWGKFVNNRPLFNAAGKIVKGPDYRAPDLTGLF